jgi:hypothetical protein
LFVLFIVILVEKKTNDTCFHIHIQPQSAWSHAGGVEENAYPTRNQTPKNVATPKQSAPLNQMCEKLRTATPT